MVTSVPASPLFPAPPATPPPSAIPTRAAFTGVRRDFRRLVMRGAALEFVTLGFYRFWLATDMRRHLWSHTALDGDAAEYTGTAKELLIGFLFALAILLPIYFAYFLLGLEAERMQNYASIPLGLFYYFFSQFAIYRARRYRLTRTVWRGVRFSMGGSGWNYAWRAGLWTLLAALTLGFALPWRQAALERFKMRHTFYGDLAGRFDGRGWDFFKRGWLLWLLALLSTTPFFLSPVFAGAVFFSPLMPFAWPFLYAAYKGIEWKWWMSGVRFGEVRFESDMDLFELIDIYWKVIGWSVLLLILLGIWFGGVVGAAWMADDMAADVNQKAMLIIQQPLVLAGMAVGYIIAALLFVMVLRIYIVRDVWQRVADTTSAYNLVAAENVAAKGELVGALGEGFADSLDVAGF